MSGADGNGDEARSHAGAAPKMTEARRGEMLFHDATLCFQQWQSCATCHPDARVDALNWDLLNDGLGNPKNTRSLVKAHAGGPAMAPAELRTNTNIPVAISYQDAQGRFRFVNRTLESWFGAKPDDTVDDASAIQEAVNAAAKAGGGAVRLAAGTYHLSHTINLPDVPGGGIRLIGTNHLPANTRSGALENQVDIAEPGGRQGRPVAVVQAANHGGHAA